jgi:L-fuculose-phosphate aldolase
MLKGYFFERRLKKEICIVGKQIYLKGFVAANDGNISVRIGGNEFLTTPTNVSKGFMKPWMIVKTDIEGNVIKGRMRPSSEIKMHLRVYAENSGVNAVVHAHPQTATTFAIAGEPLDKALLTEAVVLLGVVPVAPYAVPGTNEVPDSIAPFCKDFNAVLLKNHGVLAWGSDLKEALFRMEATENFAVLMMYSKLIFGEYRELDKKQIDGLLELRKTFGVVSGGRPNGK